MADADSFRTRVHAIHVNPTPLRACVDLDVSSDALFEDPLSEENLVPAAAVGVVVHRRCARAAHTRSARFAVLMIWLW